MKIFKLTILPVFLAFLWITVSEFVRNELLFKSYWVEHYEKLGIVFPSAPANGAVWGLWSLLLAVLIYILAKKFSYVQTCLLVWFAGFVLMWVVIGNLNVLPYGLLAFAIPLSLLEVFVAGWIVRKLG